MSHLHYNMCNDTYTVVQYQFQRVIGSRWRRQVSWLVSQVEAEDVETLYHIRQGQALENLGIRMPNCQKWHKVMSHTRHLNVGWFIIMSYIIVFVDV